MNSKVISLGSDWSQVEKLADIRSQNIKGVDVICMRPERTRSGFLRWCDNQVMAD